MGNSGLHAEEIVRGVVLELRPTGEDFDFSDIATKIANRLPADLSGCEVKYHVSMVDSFAPEFLAYIVQHGLTSFLRRQLLTEALVARGTDAAGIRSLLQGFISAL